MKQYTIRLSDSDAGGVLFFAHQFRIIHDVYEEFMQESGINFYNLLNDNDIAIPLVHASCNYKKPLFVGDHFTIKMFLDKIKKHSFILKYHFEEKKWLRSVQVGNAQTVHVVVNKSNNKSISIPSNIRKILQFL